MKQGERVILPILSEVAPSNADRCLLHLALNGSSGNGLCEDNSLSAVQHSPVIKRLRQYDVCQAVMCLTS